MSSAHTSGLTPALQKLGDIEPFFKALKKHPTFNKETILRDFKDDAETFEDCDTKYRFELYRLIIKFAEYAYGYNKNVAFPEPEKFAQLLAESYQYAKDCLVHKQIDQKAIIDCLLLDTISLASMRNDGISPKVN